MFTEQEQDDIEFIQHPLDWPLHPFLPMKSYRNIEPGCPPKIATLFRYADRYVLWSAGIDTVMRMWPEDFARVGKRIYAQAEDIVADGWWVD